MPEEHASRTTTDSLLRSRLAQAGFRVTRVRRAVIKVFLDGLSHPTADQICEQLWRQGQRISRASVYRALAAMEQSGLLRRVAVPAGPGRFELVEDGEGSSEHDWHFVCAECGRVVDIDGVALAALQKGGEMLARCQVRLTGICEECRKARTATQRRR
jgi:Fe2+ or Zn2+ uptake regulation protein